MDNMRSRLLVMFMLCTLGCTKTPEKEPEIVVSQPRIIVATNAPIYYFATRLAPEEADVRMPMREAADPAYWKPIADSISSMQNADIILVNGADYEKWLGTVTLPTSRIRNTNEGTSNLIDAENTVTHSHGDEGEHSHTGHEFTTWLDMEIASAQAEATFTALTDLYPEKSSEIKQRFVMLDAELQQLHDDFTSASDTTSYAVFSHPVYQYFSRAYGIRGQSVHWEPGAEWSHDMAHDLEHIRDHHQVKYVIWEDEPHPSTAAALSDLGLQIVVIKPGGGWSADYDFIELMKANVESIKKAMASVN